jgi:hypothetical protein
MYTHSDFYDDFIPYWDDSTETEQDHQEEPVRIKKKKVFDLSKDEDLPF